jgi:iron(II)-dependent oxidoreductase
VEWEKAATWDQHGRPVSELDRPSAAHGANLLDTGVFGTAPVGAFPGAAAPCGALGMIGDVWEWTASCFGGYPGFSAHPYREYSEVFFGDGYRVLRGGSWASSPRVATPTFRNWDLPQRRQIFAGLRIAEDA